MAIMPKEAQDLVKNSYAAAFSTCSLDGIPNVVPVSMKQVIDDETIMISDQYMTKTLANLQANPHVAVTVWNEEAGYQMKGTVTYVNEGPDFEAVAAQVHEILSSMGYDYYSKGVCYIHVDEVFTVTPGDNPGRKLA